MNKVLSILNLLRKGYVVANPEAWKKGQITVNVLATLLVSAVGVAQAFGINIPITEHEAFTLAGAVLVIVGLFNPIATVVSTDKVGVLPEPKGGDEAKPVNGLTGKPY